MEHTERPALSKYCIRLKTFKECCWGLSSTENESKGRGEGSSFVCVIMYACGTTVGRLVDLSCRLIALLASVPAPLTPIMAHQEAKRQQH